MPVWPHWRSRKIPRRQSSAKIKKWRYYRNFARRDSRSHCDYCQGARENRTEIEKFQNFRILGWGILQQIWISEAGRLSWIFKLCFYSIFFSSLKKFSEPEPVETEPESLDIKPDCSNAQTSNLNASPLPVENGLKLLFFGKKNKFSN